MNARQRKLLVSCAVLLAALGACGLTANAQQAESGAAHMRPEHQRILESWLRGQRTRWRVAEEADNENAEGLAATRSARSEPYHPYYAAGDFNADGQEDFAVALIHPRRRELKFELAVFNGPFRSDGRRIAPAFFVSGLDLRRGGLIFGAPASPSDQLVVGVFESDDCYILRPRRRSYRLVDCL